MIPKGKLQREKLNIVASCKKCSGSGCDECTMKCARVEKYADSGIPVSYWMKSFKDFAGDKNFKERMRPIVSDIDLFYDNGSSLMFVGNLGTGKSYMASVMVKIAISKGYDCKYTTMADIITSITSHNNHELMKNFLSTEFLIIDEFDSRWIFPSEKTEKLFGLNLEHIVRSRFQNHLPTILCSNTEDVDSVLSGDFSKSFRSLRSKYLDVIYVGGKDFRRSGSSD